MRHRTAALILAGVFVALFAPLVARGHVVFPHDNGIEVNLPGETPGKWNRKFNDQSSVYVPAIHQHLNGDQRGWISTWNPHSELGRPTFQLAGESKAFLLTHALSFFTWDALRLYTWQALCAVALTGAFAYLLLASLGLQPAACLAGALGLAFGVFPLYWLTNVLFLWGITWTLGVLWLCELTLRRPTAWKVLGLAVFVQSLLLTGYPQTIVWNLYLSVGFVLWRLRVRRPGARGALAGLGALALGSLLGGLAAAPVYLDLAENAARSTRLDARTAFFLEILPPLDGWRDLAGFWIERFDAALLGNPIGRDYPLKFNGITATPLWSGLGVASLLFVRRLWAGQLFCLVCLVMTLWPAAYAFGIEHLGLDVSRTIPLSAAILPGFLLAALAADRLLREPARARRGALALYGLATAFVLACVLAAGVPLAPGYAAASLVLWLGLGAFLVTRSGPILVVLALATTFLHGYSLQLERPRGEIHTSSPLTRLIKQETRGGGRFAWVEAGFGIVLPSNQETLLGVRSIHTYNSLSSRAYQELTRRFSPRGAETYGRHFTNILAPELLDPLQLSRAGVGLLLAGRPLPPSLAEPISEGGAYRPLLPPLLQAQFLPSYYARRAEGGVALAGRPAFASEALGVERTVEHDDALELRTTPRDGETLLFLSQQYHPRWRAESGDGSTLATVEVDGFYQGVLLPPGTREVRLAFRPLVRLAWIPQVAFLVAAAALLLAGGARALARRRSAVA